MPRKTLLCLSCIALLAPPTLTFMPTVCAQTYDTIIRGGTLYDGTGSPGVTADIAIQGDSIAAVGNLSGANATQQIDATGLAVSPGFKGELGQARRGDSKGRRCSGRQWAMAMGNGMGNGDIALWAAKTTMTPILA
ncbi:MAG TPA: hypothetical protein VMM76_25685 [Pirellulaceae bacterium]|nr:hypothetical protein [Pirellulaceae bacterium]